MKKRAILLSTLFFCFGFLFSQEDKDSLKGNFIYSQFYNDFSDEESWQIHKEAYVKQLKSQGLTTKQIENEIIVFENQKKRFLEKIERQREIVSIQHKKAAEHRKQADSLIKIAEIKRIEAAEHRKMAESLRMETGENRLQNAFHRKKMKEQRELATVLMQEAEEQRKQSIILRQKAEEQRIKAEESRNSFETILSKKITITSHSSNIEPILIDVLNKTTLLFSINGKINSGVTIIEIINPYGKKEGELLLEHSTSPNLSGNDTLSNYTAGSLIKNISISEIGEWQIKISPKNSEGTVNVSVARSTKPNSR